MEGALSWNSRDGKANVPSSPVACLWPESTKGKKCINLTPRLTRNLTRINDFQEDDEKINNLTIKNFDIVRNRSVSV